MVKEKKRHMTIHLPPVIDEALEREKKRRNKESFIKTSKIALILDAVAEKYGIGAEDGK